MDDNIFDDIGYYYMIEPRKDIKLYIIYGYDSEHTKIEDRDLILCTHNYDDASFVMNALLNLQMVEDVSCVGYDAKDGYAIVESCLRELVAVGIENVLGYYKFKQETYIIG